jgi:protein-tyrosine phosphatase
MRTELHFHLLPAVDDGPADDAAAIELARLAVADGTGRVVTTPHVREVELNQLAQRVQRLQGILAGARVPLEVIGGGELSPDDVGALSRDELELIAHGPPGRRWVLLEAPLEPCRPGLAAAAADLRERGFAVLIGHPERSPGLTLEQLRRQVQAGAVLQVNASSLAGVHGSRVARNARELVQTELPFVLASDAHSHSRPPLLGRGVRALLAAGVAPPTIEFAAESGPARLLAEGLPLSA